MQSHRRQYAFSLIELMVVITVIILLILILLPSFGAARSAARSAKCAANLHALGQAIATRLADQSLGTISNSCSLMDLPPYLSDLRVYACPEDNPAPEIDAKMAVYKRAPCDNTSYMYDMQFGFTDPTYPASHYADPWTYRTNLTPGDPKTSFLLNFEDERPSFGDKSFYNYYLKIVPDPSPATTVKVSTLNRVDSADVPPAGVAFPKPGGDPYVPTGGGGLHAIGTKYEIVHLSGTPVFSDWTDWARGDARVATVNITPFGLSYGMNTLYPSQISPSGNSIVILDFMRSGANMAGSGSETAAQWAKDLAGIYLGPVLARPGFARHRGKFNALISDNSVRSALIPSAVDPTNAVTGTKNKKLWWGGP